MWALALFCVLLVTAQAQDKATKGCRNHPDGYCLNYTRYTCPSSYLKSYFGCGTNEMCCYPKTSKPTTDTSGTGSLTRCRDHPEGFCIDYTREVCPSSYSYSYGGCGYGQKCCFKKSPKPKPTTKPTPLPTNYGDGANGTRPACKIHTDGYCIDFTRGQCPDSYLEDFSSYECTGTQKCCYPPPPTGDFAASTTPSSIDHSKPCRRQPNGFCINYTWQTCPAGYLSTYVGCDAKEKCCYPRPPPPTTTPKPPRVPPTGTPSGTIVPNCGRPTVNPDRKIVGGKATTIEAFPWQVEIKKWDVHHCGGSLVRANWVLTAAHCIVGHSSLSVLVGSTNIKTYSRSQVIPIVGNVVHEGYTTRSSKYDIALIKLAKSVDVNDAKTRTVCLAEEDDDFEQETCIVSGWGDLEEDGSHSDTLRHVDMPIVARNLCEYYMRSVPEGAICAGHPSGGKDSCQGDSGGPLVCKTYDGSWKQAGVVSNGVGCARVDRMGLYTEVAAYRKWIDEVIKQND